MRKYFKRGFQEIRGTHPAPKNEPSCDVMSGTRAVGSPGCVRVVRNQTVFADDMFEFPT